MNPFPGITSLAQVSACTAGYVQGGACIGSSGRAYIGIIVQVSFVIAAKAGSDIRWCRDMALSEALDAGITKACGTYC